MPKPSKLEKPKSVESAEPELKTKKSSSKVAKKVAPKKKVASKSGSKTVKKSASAKKPHKAKKAGASKKRYFKVVDGAGNTLGRYTGSTPKQAGSKAFTKMVQKSTKAGKKMPKSTNIYLRESTRQSNRKTYGYVASRRKLDEPQMLEITDATTGETKQITYYYRNDVKKIAVPEEMQGGARKKGKKVASKGKKAGSSKKSGSKAKKAGSKAKKAGGSKTKKAAPKKKASASKAKKAGGSKSAKKPSKAKASVAK